MTLYRGNRLMGFLLSANLFLGIWNVWLATHTAPWWRSDQRASLGSMAQAQEIESARTLSADAPRVEAPAQVGNRGDAKLDPSIPILGKEAGGLAQISWGVAKLAVCRHDLSNNFPNGIDLSGDLSALLSLSGTERQQLETGLKAIFERIKLEETQNARVTLEGEEAYVRVNPLMDREDLRNELKDMGVSVVGPYRGEILWQIMQKETLFRISDDPIEIGVIEDPSSDSGYAIEVSELNSDGKRRITTSELTHRGIMGRYDRRYDHLIDLEAWSDYLASLPAFDPSSSDDE